MQLWDRARHESLDAHPWDEGEARATIRSIAAAALRAFEPAQGSWPAHPLDDPESPDARRAMLYFGAGGVIWGLQRLAALGALDGLVLPDFADAVEALPRLNLKTLAAWGEDASATRSFVMGDAGLLLLQWQRTRDRATADALHAVCDANVDHPSREPMWGAPGTMLAALHMSESTGEARWREVFVRSSRSLWDALESDAALGCRLWRQQLYGSSCCYLGAGHGFAGNLHAVLRGAGLLDRDALDAWLELGLQTLQATALRDGGRVNWHAFTHPPADRLPLVQDCHGAPGIVCRLARAPHNAAWHELLAGAGETTWAAGPLAKGAGLCHGTAGNGSAFLVLHERTGEAHWLERARAFAMHAIGQVERDRARHGDFRWSLWTGDIGVALYLWDCVAGAGTRLPACDVF